MELEASGPSGQHLTAAGSRGGGAGPEEGRRPGGRAAGGTRAGGKWVGTRGAPGTSAELRAPVSRRQQGHGRGAAGRRAATATQKPERAAALGGGRRGGRLATPGAAVRAEVAHPGRAEPRGRGRRRGAGCGNPDQAPQPGRRAGAVAQGDGWPPTAGHVLALPTVQPL
ncbi:hypothetical protein LEMLEM_LOCUS14206 [Lemmus lemmus]